MSDKYDKAIEYLRENPREIWDAWQFCSTHPAGCLFMHTPNACGEWSEEFRALPYEARQRIMSDGPLLRGPDACVNDLVNFAALQRRIDEALR